MHTKTVYVHVRATLDVGIEGVYVEAPWATGQRDQPGNRLDSGDALLRGEQLVAAGGKLRFILQDDGNLVL